MEDEQSFPSTTWEWRRVKIRRPPEAHKGSAAKPHRWQSLPRRNARERLILTVSHRGGPESWWQIESRGRTVRMPGWLSIDELFGEINEGSGRRSTP